jgi:hypothetical protein
MIQGLSRWCLWLEGVEPAELRKHPLVLKRVNAVRKYRKASRRLQTKDLAKTPYLFGEIRQPSKRYLCLPRHSSQERRVVPMAFFDKTDIAHDSTLAIPGVGLFEFGVLSSAMFTAWLRTIGGRIKSDLRISIENVLNTFPWPVPRDRARIERAAKAVLDARAAHPDSSLADLYGSLTMPRDLSKAHDRLDRAVDAVYRRQRFKTEVERLSFIFERYAQEVGLMADSVVSATDGNGRRVSAGSRRKVGLPKTAD